MYVFFFVLITAAFSNCHVYSAQDCDKINNYVCEQKWIVEWHDIHWGLKYFRCVDPSPHQLFPGDQCGTGSSSCRCSAPTGTSLQSRRDMKPPSQPPDLPDHNPGAPKYIIGVPADILLLWKQNAEVWQHDLFSRTLTVTPEESWRVTVQGRFFTL